MKKMVVVICLALLAVMALPSVAGAATVSQRLKALEKAVAAIKTVDKTQTAKIASLRTDLTAAQATMAALKSDLTAAQTTIASLSSQLATVQANKALALDPYLTVTQGTLFGTKGPNIVFTGANIRVVDGSGATNDHWNTPLGLGNLIVGYNTGGVQTGSHNIVCGEANNFTGNGGLVAGFGNSLGGYWSTVAGGIDNTVSNTGASISGGYGNTASAYSASVGGGKNRSATTDYNWVAGALLQAN
jgi:hypothetical protein